MHFKGWSAPPLQINFDKVKTVEDLVAILKHANVIYIGDPDNVPDELKPFVVDSTQVKKQKELQETLKKLIDTLRSLRFRGVVKIQVDMNEDRESADIAKSITNTAMGLVSMNGGG
jgi:hypothetical protein